MATKNLTSKRVVDEVGSDGTDLASEGIIVTVISVEDHAVLVRTSNKPVEVYDPPNPKLGHSDGEATESVKSEVSVKSFSREASSVMARSAPNVFTVVPVCVA